MKWSRVIDRVVSRVAARITSIPFTEREMMSAHSSEKKFHPGRHWLATLPVLALAVTPILAQSPTPPGLFITPTALPNAIQQNLNPGLANYPNFVAGEAVKAVVSPDGNILAILTAGMNSLFDSNGNVDTAASTQFLFLYDISRGNKTSPVLKQVIQQPNAHVGLVWAPNSQTLYASGGCDDAVY